LDRENVAVPVNVVIDLDTLRGESDQIAILDGQPVPGQIGREIAQHATWWRRLVTDPVDGHLLDYGRTTYLPDKLRRFVLARDGACRTHYCTNRAESRMQLDHALEFPEGPSDAHNCGGLRATCHQLKTAGHADITDSRSDGSCTWITVWGRSIHIPPRSVLPIDPPTTRATGTTDTRGPTTLLARVSRSTGKGVSGGEHRRCSTAHASRRHPPAGHARPVAGRAGTAVFRSRPR